VSEAVLRTFSELLERAFSGGQEAAPEAREHAVRVATALLLIEVARADYEEALIEDAAVFELVKDFFSLSDEETRLLISEARREADHAASLQEFTRRLHERLSPAEKLKVVEMLWRVALADQKLDKHEDFLVRKVADLLYVSHSDLIRIRNRLHTPEL
jgi:uncharacterized tellurite resistance protein B-like protein